jgi:Autophagy-related protein 27
LIFSTKKKIDRFSTTKKQKNKQKIINSGYVATAGTDKYYFNLCEGETGIPQSQCADNDNPGNTVAVCQGTGAITPSYRSVGALQAQTITSGAQKPAASTDGLTFFYGQGRTGSCAQPRQTTIYIQCNLDQETIVDPANPPAEVPASSCKYEIYMISKYACQNYGGTDKSKSKKKDTGLSGGSIFLITLVCVLAAYLGAGIGWNMYKNGATGVEVIPNIDMWREFPGWIKDGALYIYNSVRGTGSSSTYETVE